MKITHTNTGISVSFGFLFPLAILAFGVFFIGVSFQGLPDNKTIPKIVMLLIGLLILLPRTGIEINNELEIIRTYISIFGIKFGKWQSYYHLTAISVLHHTKKYRFAGKSNLSFADVEVYYQLVLLDKFHQKKLEIYRASDKQTIKALTNQISEITARKVEKYSPKISAASLRKR